MNGFMKYFYFGQLEFYKIVDLIKLKYVYFAEKQFSYRMNGSVSTSA